MGEHNITNESLALSMVLVLVAIAHVVLRYTRFGKFTYAIGANRQAARVSGINVNRHLIWIYTIAGLLSGVAGTVTAARAISGQSGMGVSYELDAIAAVVIGGTSLFGGRGSIIGSVLGAFIVGVFNTGLSLAGVDDYWQMFAAGCLVIIAVALDQWLRRASQ